MPNENLKVDGNLHFPVGVRPGLMREMCFDLFFVFFVFFLFPVSL